MKTMAALKRSAQQSTAWRGHRMRWDKIRHGESQSIINAQCIRCSAWVQLLARPQPNQTQIAGSAVAVTCVRGAVRP